MSVTEIKIRRARVQDVTQIVSLINSYAERGEMLFRSQSQVLQQIRNYFVAVRDEEVLACGSLDITWTDLAELRSLAVREDVQSHGLGTKIVNALMADAVELGLKRVFALTYKPHFFERLGFKIIDKQLLPHKVWSICIDCLKFPVCDEVAMQIEVKEWAESKMKSG
ncbi:MAG: N-acetyltransferase [Candidatus Kryptoniota bacterium]